MAKKLSREEREEKKKRRNSIIVGSVLVALMVFGTLGAFTSSNQQSSTSENSFEYNGLMFKFVQKDTASYYVTELDDGTQLGFFSTPYEVQKLKLDTNFLNEYPISSLIFTSEPLPLEGTIPLFQQYLDSITADISHSTGKNVRRGYLKPDIFEESAIYTCDDANVQNIVLVYKGFPKTNSSPGIYPSDTDYCYDLYAADADLILLRDYLIYLHWGILNE